MSDISCYTNIYGLSRINCTCFEPNRPTAYNTSLSGLFLDGLTPLNSLKGLDNCQNKNLWQAMADSRDDSIRYFIADVNALLLRSYKLKRMAWTGGIGQIKTPDNITPSKQYAVFRMLCKRTISGVAVITAIGTLFGTTGSVTLTIKNNLGETIGTPIVLNTVAEVHTIKTLTTPITLPLYNKYVSNLEYFFIYEYSGQVPKDTNINCGCGGFQPYYDRLNPHFNMDSHVNNEWADYAMFGGMEVASLSELTNPPITCGNTTYGLTLAIEFKCKVNEVICKDAMDFVGNPLALSVAHATRYKGAVILGGRLLAETDLSRNTLTNREQLQQSIIEWEQKYIEHVNYIAENANIGSTDCLKCKDIITITKAGLLS